MRCKTSTIPKDVPKDGVGVGNNALLLARASEATVNVVTTIKRNESHRLPEISSRLLLRAKASAQPHCNLFACHLASFRSWQIGMLSGAISAKLSRAERSVGHEHVPNNRSETADSCWTGTRLDVERTPRWKHGTSAT